MRNVVAIGLLVAGLCGDPAEAIRIWNRQHESEPLSRVLLSSVPSRPDLVVGICDYIREWSGFFGVYHLVGDRVDWRAECDPEPMEQSIHHVRALSLPGFQCPVIEVLGVTHRGNGNLYLYELDGRRLTLRFSTRAVDLSADPRQFRGGALARHFCDLNNDGKVDLILIGVMEEWDEKGDSIVSSWPCGQIFFWNANSRTFVEERRLRVGIPEDFD